MTRPTACSVLPATFLLLAGGCAADPPQVAAPGVSVNAASAPLPAPAVASGPFLNIRLTPRMDPTPHVRVDMEFGVVRQEEVFRMLAGAPELLSHVALADSKGPIDPKLSSDRSGVTLTPARAPVGVATLSYDVAANNESPWKPLATRVLDDRFIGSGETLLFLPDRARYEASLVQISIDGSHIAAPNCASSLGIGSTHRQKLQPSLLSGVTFVSGAMGAAVFDAVEGHDEAAWLGYTSFDPRPAAAEVAQIRTAMGELFHGQAPPPSTLLFVGQSRPLGSYTTTSRAGGVLLQLGPSEPWSAPLRISLSQQLVRPWLGQELTILPGDSNHPAQSYWFTEGVARFFVTRLLARVGLLKPEDVRDAIVGETSVILSSGHAGKTNAVLADLASHDETARAHLAARGALYAARVNALLRDKSKGATSLDTLVLDLMGQARKQQQGLASSAWGETVGRMLGGSEPAQFDRTIERGEEVILPKTVLGHCFRATSTDYVTFDLGFDVAATREGVTSEVVGLRADGPAAKAGVKPGDIVEADYRDGHPEVLAKLTVKRGGQTLHLSYEPRGARHPGPTWTRVTTPADDKCEDSF